MICVDNFITWSNSFSVFTVHVRFVFICRLLHGPMQKSSTLTAVRKYDRAISVLNYRDWSWYVMEEVSDPDSRAHMCSHGFSLPSLSTQILIGPSFMQTRVFSARGADSFHGSVLLNFKSSLGCPLSREKKNRIIAHRCLAFNIEDNWTTQELIPTFGYLVQFLIFEHCIFCAKALESFSPLSVPLQTFIRPHVFTY